MEVIKSACKCGEPVDVETGRMDVPRTDGKRPHHPGAGYNSSRFRCQRCVAWLADSCKAAAFGEPIRAEGVDDTTQDELDAAALTDRLYSENLALRAEIERLTMFLVTIRDTGLTADGAAEHAAEALTPNF